MVDSRDGLRALGETIKRLVIAGGLGLREGTVGPVDLTLQDGEIGQIVSRMHNDVMAAIERRRPEHEESRAEWEELAAITGACQSVLDQARS